MHVLVHGYDGGVGANASADGAASAAPVVRIGGPRFGLIVSKAVGSAVVRHRVARRLRHMCALLIPELSTETDIVIRALPGAADAGSDELLRQLCGALRKLGVATGAAATGPGGLS